MPIEDPRAYGFPPVIATLVEQDADKPDEQKRPIVRRWLAFLAAQPQD